MIQYKYYHTSECGYDNPVELSIPNTNQAEYKRYRSIFSHLRSRMGANSFTYAVVNEAEGFYLQNVSEPEQFAHGLCERISDMSGETPSSYVGMLEDGSKPEHHPGNIRDNKLPDGKLPKLGESGIRPDLRKINMEFLGRIAFQLIKGGNAISSESPVVVITGSREISMQYLRALNCIFPESFINRVGFSVDCNRNPEYKKDPPASFSIRLLFPEGTQSMPGSLTYDNINNKTSDTSQLNSFARLISEINSVERLISFGGDFAPAFKDDGTVRVELIEKLSMMSDFGQHRNLEVAKQILKRGVNGCEGRYDVFGEAVQLVLEKCPAEIDEDDYQRIKEGFDCKAAAVKYESGLFNYLRMNLVNLDEDRKDLLDKLIFRDGSGKYFKETLDEYQAIALREHGTMDKALVFFARIWKKISEKSGDVSAKTREEYLKKALTVFDFVGNGKVMSEKLFTSVVAGYDEPLREELVSVLMAAVYAKKYSSNNARNGGREDCINAFGRMLEDRKLSPLDTFKYTVNVYNTIKSWKEKYKIETEDNFICNCESGKNWLRDDVIGKMPFKEMLAAFSLLNRQAPHYDGAKKLLREHLLNAQEVKSNVKVATETANIYYRDFWSVLDNEKKKQYPEISRYMDLLTNSERLSKELSDTRYRFAMGCYNTFSDKEKKEIDGVKKEYEKKHKNLSVGEFVKMVAENFSPRRTGGEKENKFIEKILPWLFGGAILLLPTIIAIILVVVCKTSVSQGKLSFMYDFGFFPLVVDFGAWRLYSMNKDMAKRKKLVVTLLEVLLLILLVFVVFHAIIW